MNKEKLLKMFNEFIEKNFDGSNDNHEEHVESETTIVKSMDEMERRALFVVLEPQESLDNVSDGHSDYYDEITVEKACRSFNKHSMKAGLFHKFTVESDLVEIEQSFITPSDFETESGISIKKGSWLMWMHFPEPLDKEDDVIWSDVLSGEFTGISVECEGTGVIINE